MKGKQQRAGRGREDRVVWFRRKIHGPAVVAVARERGLEVLDLGRFSSRPLSRDGLLLGFAAIDEKQIRRGVEQLAMVLSTVASST